MLPRMRAPHSSQGRPAMTDLSASIKPTAMTMDAHSPGLALRSLVIGLTAFLTVVDLFATQAILPSLTKHYNVTPAAMGFAVNASTMGMAIAGSVVGFSVGTSTAAAASCSASPSLAVPTALLAVAPNLAIFA